MKYIENHKLTLARLYLTSKPSSLVTLSYVDYDDDDDDNLNSPTFEYEKCQQDRGKAWLMKYANLDVDAFKLEDASSHSVPDDFPCYNGADLAWRKEEENKRLLIQQDQEREKYERVTALLEAVRSSRSSRVPAEQAVGAPRVGIAVHHVTNGKLVRYFSSSDKMLLVDDWICSLAKEPENFKLCSSPEVVAMLCDPENRNLYDGIQLQLASTPPDFPVLGDECLATDHYERELLLRTTSRYVGHEVGSHFVEANICISLLFWKIRKHSFSLIVCKLAECLLKLPRDERLSKLMIAKTANTVNSKAVKPFGDKQASKKARSQTKGSVKLINAAKLLNMALAANLILLSNDISLNPGPTQPSPSLTKGLRLLHHNICSLRNKMDELRVFCDEHRPHIVTINETWLDDSFTDTKIAPPGYSVMRKDRDKNGGGVAVYIAEQLNYSRLEESTIQTRNDNFESIWFEVCRPKTKNILCGAIYKTPDAAPAALTSWVEEILNNVTSDDSEIALNRDFNLNYLNPTSATKHFQQTAKSFHLKQIITKPTRTTEETRALIDLFLRSRPELYTRGVIPVGFSDQCAIFGVRKLHNIKRPPPKIIQSRNYKNYDPAVFSDD
ncbi:hypothetical protein AWC38_SpisGene21425 [Stylophora pistillata]|uniref:Endonuclease/exonuclease/phosphatase domain-containing protein n=1 Tax=Stylophora pistillata TaxID=50429 RepID=A0A2B4R9V8_STYPI|nr:hypothetical protein AWC38_SpisGene21425 [Stylophora pistillata]